MVELRHTKPRRHQLRHNRLPTLLLRQQQRQQHPQQQIILLKAYDIQHRLYNMLNICHICTRIHTTNLCDIYSLSLAIETYQPLD